MYYTFDIDGNILDGPLCRSAAEAAMDDDPDAVYIGTLEDEPVRTLA
jgi:hypothetical protein